jgi:hypothetical protein
MTKNVERSPIYQSFSLSETYDSRNGFTEIDAMYNDNGNEQFFSEIIDGSPNSFDLNERLENDFLSSPFDNTNDDTFFSDNDMIRVKKRKSIKRKSIKRKNKRKTSKKKIKKNIIV